MKDLLKIKKEIETSLQEVNNQIQEEEQKKEEREMPCVFTVKELKNILKTLNGYARRYGWPWIWVSEEEKKISKLLKL